MASAADSSAALSWALGEGGGAAYSTREDGHMFDEKLRSAWLASVSPAGSPPRAAIMAGCVHKPLVKVITPEMAEEASRCEGGSVVSGVDGLVACGSVARGLTLLAPGADCPGIAIRAGPECIGVAHCGWRPTAGGMVSVLVTSMEEGAEAAGVSLPPRSEWAAVIGPGISGAHYEVDGPVLESRDWPDAALWGLREVTAEDEALGRGKAGPRMRLDLRAALRSDLEDEGLPSASIVVSEPCTWDDDRLRSHRQDGGVKGLNQALAAWIS